MLLMTDNVRTLEARLNAGERDGCTLCGGLAERESGAMEVYLGGTAEWPIPGTWVCPDCAGKLDENLCRFAYGFGFKLEFTEHPAPEDSQFGRCPVCASDGPYLNVGKDHWKICERHGLKWWMGRGIFSTYELQAEEDWARNEQILARFRDITGSDGELSPDRVVRWPWRARVRRRLAAIRRPLARASSWLVARLPRDFRRPRIAPRHSEPMNDMSADGSIEEDVPF